MKFIIDDFTAHTLGDATLSIDQCRTLSHMMANARKTLRHAYGQTLQAIGLVQAKRHLAPGFVRLLRASFRLSTLSRVELLKVLIRLKDSLFRLYAGLRQTGLEIWDTPEGEMASGCVYAGVARGLTQIALNSSLVKKFTSLQQSYLSASPSSFADAPGVIRIRFAIIKSSSLQNGIHTLIHEATHKFVASQDFCYIPCHDLISYERDMEQMGIPATGKWYQMSELEALNNADSLTHYALFMPKTSLLNLALSDEATDRIIGNVDVFNAIGNDDL